MDFKQPKTKSDMRAFLGYYWHFIKDFAKIAHRKTAPVEIKWTDGMWIVFQALCNALCDVSKLTLPKSDDVFKL